MGMGCCLWLSDWLKCSYFGCDHTVWLRWSVTVVCLRQPRTCNCHLLSFLSWPQLNNLILYTLESEWSPLMTNCSDLKLSCILFCPSGWSQSNIKVPFATGRYLASWMFCTLFSACLDLLQALFLTYYIISWCCWSHELFDFLATIILMKVLTYYHMISEPFYQTLMGVADSLGNGFIKFSKMQLNIPQSDLLLGLYGVVTICWTPYILCKQCIKSFSKLWLWSLWILIWMPHV